MSFPHPAIRRCYVADAARSTVVLELDEPAAADSAAGLLLDFDVGTPRTVTGASASGYGVALSLSGAMAAGDVAELVIGAGNTIRGVSGRLAAGAVAVENQIAGGSPPVVPPTPGAIVRLAHGDPGVVLAARQEVRVDVTGGAPPTITMAPAPDDGDEFTIVNIAGSFASTACPITANAGQTIEDAANPGTFGSSATLTQASFSGSWFYDAARARWKLRTEAPASAGAAPSTIVWSPPPGALTAAAIAAHITAGATVIRLSEGTYLVDTTTPIPSGVRVVGAGSSRTFVQPAAGWVPSSGLADDPTNAIFTCVGALNTGVLNTSINAVAAAGDTQLTALAAATLTDGQWAFINGSNYGLTDELLGSTGGNVVLKELVRVNGTVASSVTVPVRWPTLVHHAAGAAITLKGVTPVVDTVFEGFTFKIGGRNFACGLYCKWASNVRVIDVGGSEFCHAMIRTEATHLFEWHDLVDYGSQSCVVYHDSTNLIIGDGMRSYAGPTRRATNGTPWPKITLRNRCTGVRIANFEVRHGILGLMCPGMHNGQIVNGIFVDFDAKDVVDTLYGGNHLNASLFTPVGIFNCGADTVGASGDADWGLYNIYDNLTFIDCGDSVNSATFNHASDACYIHDNLLVTIGKVVIANPGRNPNGSTVPGGAYRNRNGFHVQDSNGSVGQVMVSGCGPYPSHFSGIFTDLLVDTLNVDGTPGFGFTSGVILLDSPLLPRIRMLHSGNGVSFDRSSGWISTPDTTFTIDRWSNGNGGFELYGVTTANAPSAVKDNYTNASTGGSCAVITNNTGIYGFRGVEVPTAGDTRPACIVAQGSTFWSTGPILVATKGGTAIVDAAVTAGAYLKLRADQRLTTDSAPSFGVTKFYTQAVTAGAGKAPVCVVMP